MGVLLGKEVGKGVRAVESSGAAGLLGKRSGVVDDYRKHWMPECLGVINTAIKDELCQNVTTTVHVKCSGQSLINTFLFLFHL